SRWRQPLADFLEYHPAPVESQHCLSGGVAVDQFSADVCPGAGDDHAGRRRAAQFDYYGGAARLPRGLPAPEYGVRVHTDGCALRYHSGDYRDPASHHDTPRRVLKVGDIMGAVQQPEVTLADRIERAGVSGSLGDWLIRAFAYFCLTLIALTMVTPFLWMIATSFKGPTEIRQPNFFPKTVIIDNYEKVLFETDLPRWYLNSLIVATFSTLSVAVFDSLAGYVFAKYQFPGKRFIFIMFLSSLMIPTEMLIIPWYIMSVNPPIGSTWVNTYWGIAFPGLITAAGIFLMRQFMQGVPDELLDAGRIDGVSEF